ncbi:MAG: 4Fe-4S dicluster domain-containing protein [Armatimonadota bacterium]|nr:MAG: 4Fe-4S dicluster domain-containing protein [Armatimonadota bacterium]
MKVAHRIVLHFPPAATDQPIIYRLSKDYDLVFNILKASVSPQEEGLMVLDLSGEEADYQRGAEYLRKHGVQLQPLVQDIRKNDDRCVDCGACVGVCPTEALTLERPSMRVLFDPDQCVVCGECVPCCPVEAMELRF